MGVPVDLAALRRRAALDRHRHAAADYIATQEARLEAVVRAALVAAFAPVLDRFRAGPVTAAAQESDPDGAAWAAGFASADDLAAIRTGWVRQVDDALLPFLAELFDTGAMGTLVELDASAAARAVDTVRDSLDDVLDFRARDFLDDATNRLVGIGDTAWTGARERLVEGFQAGESIPDLAARIEAALDVAVNRATTIARTEVVAASNAGSMAGARALGTEFAPPVKVWMASLDARTRDTHADADGQEVGLEETFTVGGDQLDYPGDPAGSPGEVINCRCTVVYRDEPTPEGQPSIDPEGRQGLAASTTNQEGDMRRRQFTTATGTVVTIPEPPGRYAPGDPPPDVVEAVEEVVAEDAPLVIEVPAGANLRAFEAIGFVEGRWTGDKRYVLPNALRWDGLLPSILSTDHAGTVESVVGYYGEVTRVPGPGEGESLGVFRGFLDLGPEDHPNDAARDLVARLEGGQPLGTSMELDDETAGGIDPATAESSEEEWMSWVVEDARVRALTVCATGAFAECRITLDPEGVDIVHLPPAPDGPVAVTSEQAAQIEEEREQAVEDALDDLPGSDVVIVAAGRGLASGQLTEVMVVGDPPEALVAASPPVRPPASWFDDPGLSGPTPLTITADGRVFGHLAAWGTCHTGYPNQCVTPPRSATGYALFNTGELETEEGTRVAVGRLTMGTGHAATKGPAAKLMAAAAHYDNTGTAIADVHAGEDEHGIWLAGAMRPHVTEAQFREAMASPPSGDWRKWGTDPRNRELIAALHVNAPGFPIVRATPDSLVAAGMVTQRNVGRPSFAPNLAAAAAIIASSIGRDPASRLAELRDLVHPPALQEA